ncbi:unnamed protein product [Microthlaspi erraticum]|uniref:Uncharacterized protein n=1 Tax=Microthlaspi erraticum TaxID=1685480 RepID=A0A6D2HEW7_9BRAS|nr:unnamed protein product [Microthlaspi erraticum]
MIAMRQRKIQDRSSKTEISVSGRDVGSLSGEELMMIRRRRRESDGERWRLRHVDEVVRKLMMRKPKSSKVFTATVKKEIIEIESDSDRDEEAGGRVLALCGGQVNASTEIVCAEKGQTGMEIVCADDDCNNSGLEYDVEYKKYLASCTEINLYLPHKRDASPMRLMYTEMKKGRAVKSEKRRSESALASRCSKRLKIDNGKADRRRKTGQTKKTIKLESKRKREDSRATRKVDLSKKTIKVEPRSSVKDTKQKKGERKIDLTKKKVKLEPQSSVKDKKEDARRMTKIKKENEQSAARRNAKSETVLRASKRLRTENRTTHKKEETKMKITVSKSNVKAKTTKDNVSHSFKPCKEESEETLSAVDKGYAYFLAFVRNSITVVPEPERKVKPVENSVCLYDPDIIAVSDHPFFDGGKSPFEANRDGKVIDLEDGIEPDNIFNSSFSKRLMEVLREPYDKKEFVKLYHQASHKRPLTRYRQLRNGTEIEYNVHNQLTHSYLQDYPDFKKQLSRYRKDPPRALNLLRGFLFYLENITLEGAFKPWKYEQRLMRECKILYASSSSAPHSS